MKIPYHARPGRGFVLLVSVVLLVIAFFSWGASEPRIDRAWRALKEIEIGERGLSKSDFRLLQELLTDHPALAQSLLEDQPNALVSANEGGVVTVGFAYLIRVAPSDAPLLEIELIAPAGAEPVRVEVRTADRKAEGDAAPDRPFAWRLPDDGPFPQLVEVFIAAGRAPPKGRRPREHPPVRPRLRGAP